MFERNALLAVYHDSGGIEEAVRELRKSGFDMKKVSIAGRDHHPEDGVAGYYLSGGRIRYWGKLDTFWSNIWGVLSGWAFFSIPGAGPVLVAGPLAGWIIAALEDAAVVGGLGIVGAALYSIGLPKESILNYESALKDGKFLLIAHGSIEDIARARQVVRTTRAAESMIHGV